MYENRPCFLCMGPYKLRECRTKHPPDKTPPAHFGIGGQNTPRVFYRVDITPPATYERVDKTPLVSFARWTKSPPIMWTKPPSYRIFCVYYCYRILVPRVIVCLQWYSRQNPFQEMNINVCLSTIFLFQKCMRA